MKRQPTSDPLTDPRHWIDPGEPRPTSGPWSSGPPYFGRPVPRLPYVPTKADIARDAARATYRSQTNHQNEAVPNPKGRERT